MYLQQFEKGKQVFFICNCFLKLKRIKVETIWFSSHITMEILVSGKKPNDLDLTHRASAPGPSWFISTIKNMMFLFFGARSPVCPWRGKNPNFFHCHLAKWFSKIAFFKNPLIIFIACIWIAIQVQMTNPTLVRYIYTF